MIPMVDFKREYLSIKAEIDGAIKEVFDSGWFVLGKQVESFENEFASYIGAKHAIGVGSGTEALHLALIACGVQKDDEVITVPNTAVPTVSAIDFAGAKPVFVDIDKDSYCMDPAEVEEKITKKTKAIMPVHLFGQAADMDPLIKLAKEHGLNIIEDACQAHGSIYKNKKVGALGDAGCFSFYPTKNLGAYGDAGIVTTNDAKIADKVRSLRNYGQSETRYVHKIRGFNSRLDEIQAAVLRAKLKHLDKWNEQRRKLADKYSGLLSKSKVAVPKEKDHGRSCNHLYVIRSEKRDELQKYLKDHGVVTNIHYPIPVYLQEAYGYLGVKRGACPIAEAYAEQILSIPLYPQLKDEEAEKVASLILEFEKK
ncbi:DegT/DnrJ/EryC1/StrS family aminotransferase [Candidatus Margulisiibacteriota bacterium]